MEFFIVPNMPITRLHYINEEFETGMEINALFDLLACMRDQRPSGFFRLRMVVAYPKLCHHFYPISTSLHETEMIGVINSLSLQRYRTLIGVSAGKSSQIS
ncbi:hypothetical protein AVEN_220924-1 [Araneus ventricosus]|uniref:Uncharacterized protein n=1 Tax=Araneus ventricosus TaxID=182803 RepID=A0A4Y2MI19_ARAVE|nr:hypothetical protein AVEN_220924-1 [Araneus ventricosus]